MLGVERAIKAAFVVTQFLLPSRLFPFFLREKKLSRKQESEKWQNLSQSKIKEKAQRKKKVKT